MLLSGWESRRGKTSKSRPLLDRALIWTSQPTTSGAIAGIWLNIALSKSGEYNMTSRGVLSVIVPAFNEERTLEVILKHVLEQPEVGEIIVVDDGSTDNTWAIVSRIGTID